MWSFNVQAALFAVIIAATTTAALLLRSRRPLYLSYAGFALSVGLFYSFNVIEQIFPNFHYICNCVIISAGVCLICTASFFDVLLGEAGVAAISRRRKTYLSGLFAICIGLTPLAHSPWVKTPIFFIIMFLFWIRVRIVLKRAHEVKSQAEQIRLRYLAYAGAFALLLLSSDFSSRIYLPLPPIGGIVVAIYLYFIFQALLASRLLDFHELLGKGLVFATLTILLAAIYGVMAKKGHSNSTPFLFNVVLASSIVLILFDPLRNYLEEQTTRFFYREYITFAQDIKKACRVLAGFVELKPAVDFVLDQIYDNKRATHAGIYLLDFDGTGFILHSHRGPAPAASFDGRKHPVLFRHIIERLLPIHGDQIKKRLTKIDSPLTNTFRKFAKESHSEKEDRALIQDLEELNFELFIPLRNDTSCVGILALSDKRLSEAYSSDEIIALAELSDQLAITIQNSHLFSVLKERDRLAAIGEMSAGLAHEIRNPLAAIKGAAQTLDPRHLSGEESELLQIIVDEVNRLNKVVTEFLDYSRPYRGTFSPLSLNNLVQRTIRLLEHDLEKNLEITLDLESSLPEISGDVERLRQVLINLVLNAKDAIGDKGTIRISTCSVGTGPSGILLPKGKKKTHVELRVHDTGTGISPKMKDKLFIPFFTTKQKGTGLGLATCQRIIRDHKGVIDFRSISGKGSTFIVRLPTSTTFFTCDQHAPVELENTNELRN